MKITPTLAESWQVDPTVKTLTTKLKGDAELASGSSMHPENMAYSYIRAVTPDRPDAFILNVLGWQPENIASQLKKIDDHTIQVQWSVDANPAPVLNILSTPIASIVDGKPTAPNAKNNDFGSKWLKMHSAGSGAFRMCICQPHQAIVIEASTSSLTGTPKLKDAIIKNVPDPATRRLLIQQGDADTTRDPGIDQIDTLQGKSGVKVTSTTSTEQNYLVFNIDNKDNPLMSNPVFREAAHWLISYDDITKNLLKGQYFTHQSFPPVGFPGAPGETPFIFNPARAKEILAKAETKDPHLMFDAENKSSFTTITQSIQASPARGGVKVDLLSAVGSQVYSHARAYQHQGAIRMWLSDYFNAYSDVSSFAYNDGKFNTVTGLSDWKIPKLSRETLAAVAEPDSTRRLDLYKKTQQELQRSSLYVFTDQGKTQVAMRDNVQGYQRGLNVDMVWFDQATK